MNSKFTTDRVMYGGLILYERKNQEPESDESM